MWGRGGIGWLEGVYCIGGEEGAYVGKKGYRWVRRGYRWGRGGIGGEEGE